MLRSILELESKGAISSSLVFIFSPNTVPNIEGEYRVCSLCNFNARYPVYLILHALPYMYNILNFDAV